MSELKPCPFCGSGYIDTGCLTVGCCRCGANGPEGYEGVTETWNDRPIEDALRAEVERLKVAEGEAMLVVESQDASIAALKADLEKCRKAYGKLFNENAALQGEVDALKAKIEAITLWRRRW